MVKIGDKVSLWVEGEITEISKTYYGIKLRVINDKTHADCFVPLTSIEPSEDKEVSDAITS